jgi:hypothetical protein
LNANDCNFNVPIILCNILTPKIFVMAAKKKARPSRKKAARSSARTTKRRKAAPKKAARKTVKKKAAKKRTARKTLKRAVKKTTRRATPKKRTVKKTAKKAAKKPAKKAAPRKIRQSGIKKVNLPKEKPVRQPAGFPPVEDPGREKPVVPQTEPEVKTNIVADVVEAEPDQDFEVNENGKPMM